MEFYIVSLKGKVFLFGIVCNLHFYMLSFIQYAYHTYIYIYLCVSIDALDFPL
jgi:hypothetical protein